MKSRFSMLNMLLLAFAFALAACAPAAEPGTPDLVTGAAIQTDVLVDTEWVLANLNTPSIRFIDVSGNVDAFNDGHLPAAQYVDWVEDLTNPDDPVRGQILTQDGLSALLSRLGIENGDTIVLYDNINNLLAARAYWVLKYYQHENVLVYNGGAKKWVADGQTFSTDIADVVASNYVAASPDEAIRTDYQYVLDHLDDSNVQFCDARSPGEYAGTDARSARGGRIPGAIGVEWVNAVNEDGTFVDTATLATLYSAAGFSPDNAIITYCQTGVRGAHTWFVLRELLGYPDVRNYDGSWEEYGNIPDAPIEQ